MVVGPLKSFTAVIGTNGSGKSNLMDAISFVLGVKTSQLRGNQLRDLVYRNLEDPTDNPSKRKAYVKLVYQHADSNESDDPSSSEVEFMRSVTLNGSSEYRVRGEVLSLEKYNAELADIGVLVKARNFLVFQNEVEGIASKSPRDLTAMFEEVSESAEFRQKYEDARLEHDAASTEVTHFWKKRKDVAAEKKQYKEQQQEAEKFHRLQQQIADTKTERALYELFHVDEDLKTVRVDLAAASDELEERQNQLAKKEEAFLSEKKRISELDKERGKLERKKRKLADEIEKLRPVEVRFQTELSGLARRIKGDENHLEKLQEEGDKRKEEIDSLETKLRECREGIQSVQEEIREAEEASVSAESMTEYRSLKEQVATKTSALQQELEVEKRNAEGVAQEKLSLESREKGLKDFIAAASGDADANNRKASDLREQLRGTENERGELDRDQARQEELGRERRKVRDQLEKTIDEVTQALREAKADMNESGRERAKNNAFEQMKNLFPGVYGRLSDLCQPTQTRYREAVAVILGKMMDAIVVENEKVGSDCIRFLKDQRVGTETFIPLEDIRPRPIDESLRRLGGTARLVVDVLKHRDVYERAVHYAAGNSVVCDTLDEARRLRYEGGRKLKICSLDGTLINRAGFMTGGVTHGDRSGTRKWDRAEIDTLKRKRHQAQQELNALGGADSDRRAAASLAEKIDERRRRFAILQQDLRDALSRVQSSQRDAEQSSREIESLTPQLRSVSVRDKAVKGKLRATEARLHGLENELFGDFAQRHQIDSVQQFEEQFVRKSEKIRKKQVDLETQEVALKTSLKLERNKSKQNVMQRLEKKITTQQNKKDSVEQELSDLRSKRTEFEDRAKVVSDGIDDNLAQKEQAASSIADKRQEFRKESELINESKKQYTQKRTKFEQLQFQRVKLLTAAKVSHVSIPTRDADSDEEDNDGLALDVSGDVIMGTEGDDDAEGSNQAAVEVDANCLIDYSSLSRRHRAAATLDKQKEMLESFSERVRSLERQVNGIAPNMKATEHMAEVVEKLGTLDREAEEARIRQNQALSSFEDIKQKRQDRFSTCFNHVANKINEVYQQLTKSATYPMGGNAYLSLERQDEPYLGGIKFNAMPPTKRFRDMEQLSGGERTVAALALLFAIHDFRPSPFFVLDEVDAALDKLNVGRVSSYVKSRTPDLQTIVISLKDSFYERADALVGIYRDVSIHSSRLLTLDLTRFDDAPDTDPVAA